MNLEDLKALCDKISPDWSTAGIVTQGVQFDQYAARGPWVPTTHPDARAQADADMDFIVQSVRYMPLLVETLLAKRELAAEVDGFALTKQEDGTLDKKQQVKEDGYEAAGFTVEDTEDAMLANRGEHDYIPPTNSPASEKPEAEAAFARKTPRPQPPLAQQEAEKKKKKK